MFHDLGLIEADICWRKAAGNVARKGCTRMVCAIWLMALALSDGSAETAASVSAYQTLTVSSLSPPF